MGENYKTELEIELEKALEEKGYFFPKITAAVQKRLAEADLEEMPDMGDAIILKEAEFMPDEVRDYMEPRAKEQWQKWVKYHSSKGVGGYAGMMTSTVKMFLSLMKTMVGDEITERTAAIDDYILQYTDLIPACQILQLSKLNEYDVYQEVLLVLLRDRKIDQIAHFNIDPSKEREFDGQKMKYATKYTKDLVDMDRIDAFGEKYKEGTEADAKEFVKDLMGLIGA